jgi:Predicted oxidoreductase
MRKFKLGTSNLEVPALAVGCMRINGLEPKAAEEFVQTALDNGANFFDHADIYGKGECEEIFAKAIGMNADIREKIILQSKCGIKMGEMFDFSKEHILASVDGILKRLNTDYLDVLLLHRPDALVEPEEVAAAFDTLQSNGKVRNFGVSNQDPNLMMLLMKYLKQPIVANQLQLSITNATMMTQTMNMNIEDDMGLDRDNGVLNFCRLHDITIQAWSPFQYGFFEGVFVGSDKYPELNKVMEAIADKYGVSTTTIAVAWINRHPANIQTVTGTTNPTRLKDCIKATDIRLTREEWYQLYLAAGHRLP